MQPLTRRQKDVLRIILDSIRKKGQTPSLQDIAEELGITYRNAIVGHLDALERKGYIRRAPGSRAIQILGEAGSHKRRTTGIIYLPIIGEVAAGTPITAEENIVGHEPVPKKMVHHPHAFLLRVTGDSMIDEHILDGDLVVVAPNPQPENGEIVVAMIEGDATVKKFYKRKHDIELRPANKNHESLYVRDRISIVGKVSGVLRGT